MMSKQPDAVKNILAILTLAFVGCGEANSSDPEPTSVVANESLKVEPPAVEEPAPALVEVVASSSGSIHSSSRGFALLEVSTQVDLADLQLHVRCTRGCAVADSPDAEWTSLGGFRVLIGGLSANASRSAVVVFEMSEESAEYTVHATYDGLDGTSDEVSTPPVTMGVSRSITDPEVYTAVQLAASNHALKAVEHQRENGQHELGIEALDAVYEDNVSVGLALRVTGKLRESQRQLAQVRAELDAELAELRKPKPRVKKKQRVIEIITNR